MAGRTNDSAKTASDRTAEQQGAGGLNAASAGLNPCCQSFNDTYREMIKSQLGKITGELLKPELLDAVEERLNHNGYKMEDIASDPENYQDAIAHAFKQAKDGKQEEELARGTE